MNSVVQELLTNKKVRSAKAAKKMATFGTTGIPWS